jgi:hypothetical protein
MGCAIWARYVTEKVLMLSMLGTSDARHIILLHKNQLKTETLDIQCSSAHQIDGCNLERYKAGTSLCTTMPICDGN